MNEYYEAFGPAARVIREYFEYWEEFTGSLKENTKFTNSSRADKIRLYPQIYTDEVIGNARAILDKALPVLQQASTEFRERFRNIELGLEHTVLFLEAMKDGTIGNGTEGSALMDFRHKYASRNVINPYFITYFEISHRLF